MPTTLKNGQTVKMQRRWVRGKEYVLRNEAEGLTRRVVYLGKVVLQDGSEVLLIRPLKAASKFRS